MLNSDVLSILFVLKSAYILVFLLFASFCDIRTQTVPNRLWTTAFWSIFPFIIAEIFILGLPHLFDILISGTVFFLFSSACFFLRIFGGADCKAFLLISLVFPIKASDFFNIFNSFDLFSSFPFAVLFNSLLLSLIFSIFFIFFRFFKDFQKPVFPQFPEYSDISESAGKISVKQILMLRTPFLPSLTWGFVFAVSRINLFDSFFHFFFSLLSLFFFFLFPFS